MVSNETREVVAAVTSAVTPTPDPHAEKKWSLTIAAFSLSGIALFTSVIVTVVGYIVSNRCWNMLSNATKVTVEPRAGR